MMGEWIVLDGRLTLNGRDTPPTADDIFRSVIEGECHWNDVPPGRSGAASKLAFSRYPAVPVLVLDTIDGHPFLLFEARLPRGGRRSIPPAALIDGHFIDGDTWYPLDPESTHQARELAADCELSNGGRISSLRSILTLKQGLQSGPIDDRLVLDAGLAAHLAPDAEGAPRRIIANLYPYQLQGWRWLRFVIGEGVGGLLADEMGLGKTLQVISVIADPGIAPSCPALIVAPGSVLENWCREISRFAPSLSILKHQGAARTGSPLALDGYDVVVTSYDTIVRDGAMMNLRDWSLVVLDEAQNIRNPEAQRTRAVKRLRRRVGLAVTGTPFENRLLDIWSLMDFVRPGYLGSQYEFSKRFLDSPKAAEQLETVISPLILRRRIEDVAQDLPERIDIPQILELDQSAAKQYETLRASVLAEYSRAASLVALTKLRMFCTDPQLVGAYSDNFVKLQRLDELLAEIFDSDEKVLVFTSYTEMADKIVSRVRGLFSVSAETLDGRRPISDRQGLIDQFTATTGSGALVLNPRAGGTGLNITAANHVIHYNPEWNPATEDQASARAHRRGQTRSVTVHQLLIAGTVEEVIAERVQRKRDLSNAAVVGVEGTSEDLKDIVAALDRSPVQREKP